MPLLLILALACKNDPVVPDDTGEPAVVDQDNDGFSASEDCDDDDPSSYPGADELCDGVDNDCDAEIDEDPVDASTWYADTDADGYGDASASTEACTSPSGHTSDATDCDDTANAINPSATEICNDLDDDCDGLIDVDDDSLDASTYYPDTDLDGYGDDAAGAKACEQPADSTEVGGDCDDGDIAINPDATEVCDGADNDCDGLTDDADDSLDSESTSSWYSDGDGDGFGDDGTAVRACDAPSDTVGEGGDCDDSDAAINPGAGETPLDGIDQDCDGEDVCTDLSCDGLADMALPTFQYNTGADSTGVLHGDGSAFTLAAELTTCGTWDVDAGDVNGDGYLDIVVGSYQCDSGYPGESDLFYGSASGHSDSDSATIESQGASALHIADLDGDGYDDIIAAGYYYGGSHDLDTLIHWGSASGPDGSTALPGYGIQDIAVGDVDADGYTDLLICSYAGDENHLYYGSATGFDSANVDTFELGYVRGCLMEDFDQDGYLDLAFASYFYGAWVQWGSGSGLDSADTTELDISGYLSDVVTGDFNADGYPDLVVTTLSDGTYDTTSEVFYGDASGVGSTTTELTTQGPWTAVAADLDGDGYDDLVTSGYRGASGGAASVAGVFLGSASGLPGTADYSATTEGSRGITVSDLDRDGFMDIVASSYQGTTVPVFWGSSAGWSDADSSTLSAEGVVAAPLVASPDAVSSN